MLSLCNAGATTAACAHIIAAAARRSRRAAGGAVGVWRRSPRRYGARLNEPAVYYLRWRHRDNLQHAAPAPAARLADSGRPRRHVRRCAGYRCMAAPGSCAGRCAYAAASAAAARSCTGRMDARCGAVDCVCACGHAPLCATDTVASLSTYPANGGARGVAV